MSRDVSLYHDDIVQSCRKILRYTQDMDFAAFEQDEKTFDAVVRNLEVIGEVVKHLPEEYRCRFPRIEWRKIAGLRDMIAHAYFGLDSAILWDVVCNKIPQLLDALE